MASLTEYLPHRQVLPRRYCTGCSALLTSFNETSTCDPCERGWADPLLADGPLPQWVKDSLMDAVGEMLA